MDLATLVLKVDSAGAVQSVERLNTSLDKHVQVSRKSEAASLASGTSWRQMAGVGEQATRVIGGYNVVQDRAGGLALRFAAAEREAYTEATRLASAIRTATTEVTRQQAAIIQGELGMRRFAAAEREAYTVNATMAVGMGASNRQMTVAAQRALMLSDAFATGSVMSGSFAAKILGLGSSVGRILGPAGIAVAAAAGFAAAMRGIGSASTEAAAETKRALEDIAKALDTAPAMARLRELHFGTRSISGKLTGGIPELQAKLAGLGTMPALHVQTEIASERARAKAITETTAALKAAQEEFKTLSEFVQNWQAMPIPKPLDEVVIGGVTQEYEDLARALAKVSRELTGVSGFGVNRAGLPDSVINGAGLPQGFGGKNSLVNYRPQGLVDAEREMAEADRFTAAFHQNLSRSVGDAIARGLMEGLRSPEAFARSLRDIASTALGQALSDKMSGKIQGAIGRIGGALAGGGAGAGALAGIGAGLGIFAMVDNFFKASDDQQKAAKAIRDAAVSLAASAATQRRQNVAQWGARAGATSEEQALFGLQDQAAGFAEQIFAAFGERNLPSHVRQSYEFMRRNFGSVDFNEMGSIQEYLSLWGNSADVSGMADIMAAFEKNVAAMTRAADLATADAIGTYRGGLSLSGHSPLSPIEQAREARRQYESLIAAALGGDRAAAEKLPGASSAFLDASRAVNASGGRYVADFNAVRSQLDQVEALFRGRATHEEEMASLANQQVAIAERSNEIIGQLARDNNASNAAILDRLESLERAVRG